MDDPLDQHTPAPQINGRLLQTLVIARADLPTSPQLPRLTALLIESFQAQHHQPLLPPESERFPGGSEQLLREIGPGSWTIILADAEDASTIYGTVTVEPKDLTPASLREGSNEEAPKHHLDPAFITGDGFPLVTGETRWTVRSLCANIRFQKRGIADWLMLQAEHLILKQEAQANARRLIGSPTTIVRLLLTTIEELTGAWYVKRGWAVYHTRRMPPGFIGSEGGFTLVDMFKLLELPPATATVSSTATL